MPPTLASRPPLLALPPGVSAVGLALDDYEAVAAALQGYGFEGVPERAVVKRRAEFMAGRFAALQALRALGVGALPGRNDDGSPRWPAPVVGSITHGAERALCAVASAADFRSLGIDAERLLGPDAAPELRARICAQREREVLAEGVPAPESYLISLVFSAKESLYKCLYPLARRFMDFHAARVVAASGRAEPGGLQGELTLELSEPWSEELPAGRRFRAVYLLASEHVETAVTLGA